MLRLSLYMYLVFSTFGVVGFFVPLYLGGKGMGPGQIGLVVGCGALISMAAQPFWGYVSDRFKTVKKVLLALLGAMLVFSTGLFHTDSFLALTLFYTAFMFFNSAAGPLTETLCISYTTEKGKDYGSIRYWGELGVGSAALVCGLLLERTGLERLGLIYGTLLLLALAAACWIRDAQAAPVPVDVRSLSRIFGNRRLLVFFGLVLLVGIPHRMNDSLLSLDMQQLGASNAQVGLAWVMATASSVPSLILAGRLLRRWGELRVMLAAAVIYAGRWAIYSVADHPETLIAAQLLHSLTFPLFFMSAIRYLGTLVPPELKASGQAAFAVVFGGLSGIIGSASGGRLMEWAGAGAAYGLGSVLALLGAAALLAAVLRQGADSRRSPDVS